MSQTVTRAMEILKLIAGSPRSLGEVAEHLDVHKSTAFRLLQTLEEGGFTRHLPDGRHAIGFGIIPLAQHAIDQIDMRTIAHTRLQRLAEKVGHTIHLGQFLEDQVVYIDKIDGVGTVAMGSRIGLPAEAHTAGVAKVVLAFLPDLQLERALKRVSFHQYTPTTITTLPAFRTELQLVRERGWAEDDGEKEDFINCIALPIRDASGRVTLGMSVTALRAVAGLEELRKDLPTYQQVAASISRELGWKGDEPG